MFLVFEIARNRYSSRFNANITSALILVEKDCFGIFDTASDRRFGFLKIAFRNRRQLLRATAPSEAGENTVFDLQLSVDVLSPCAQTSFHEGFLEVVAVEGKRKEKKGGRENREGTDDLLKGGRKAAEWYIMAKWLSRLAGKFHPGKSCERLSCRQSSKQDWIWELKHPCKVFCKLRAFLELLKVGKYFCYYGLFFLVLGCTYVTSSSIRKVFS